MDWKLARIFNGAPPYSKAALWDAEALAFRKETRNSYVTTVYRYGF